MKIWRSLFGAVLGQENYGALRYRAAPANARAWGGPMNGQRGRIRMVAEKATQADPAKRYQTVSELQEAMRAFLHGGLHLPRKAFRAGEVIFNEGDKGD